LIAIYLVCFIVISCISTADCLSSTTLHFVNISAFVIIYFADASIAVFYAFVVLFSGSAGILFIVKLRLALLLIMIQLSAFIPVFLYSLILPFRSVLLYLTTIFILLT